MAGPTERHVERRVDVKSVVAFNARGMTYKDVAERMKTEGAVLMPFTVISAVVRDYTPSVSRVLSLGEGRFMETSPGEFLGRIGSKMRDSMLFGASVAILTPSGFTLNPEITSFRDPSDGTVVDLTSAKEALAQIQQTRPSSMALVFTPKFVGGKVQMVPESVNLVSDIAAPNSVGVVCDATGVPLAAKSIDRDRDLGYEAVQFMRPGSMAVRVLAIYTGSDEHFTYATQSLSLPMDEMHVAVGVKLK